MGFCSFGMTLIIFELARCSFGMTHSSQYYDNCLQYDIVNNL